MRKPIVVCLSLGLLTAFAGAAGPGGMVPNLRDGKNVAMEEGAQLPAPIRVVRQALHLSDQQVATLLTLREEAEPSFHEATQMLRERQVLLESILSQEDPDFTQLGEALLSVRAARHRIAELREEFLEHVSRFLEDEQQQLLASFHHSARVQPLLPAFRAVGLLP